MRASRILILAVALLIAQLLTAQKVRPKIGVALSGGGAKGLAHIGILKAIDSAGIKVDYITGTSMGSIIGGLYAAGYSAAELEKIARKADWDEVLSNQSSLRAIVMEEKEEYSKYAVELPWVNNGFKLPSGVVEGEELWLKFSELFFPVYNIKDFSKFSIPFKCITTDIETGEAVVIDTGEIITAVRASMAIPSVFTAIEHNGKRLIDGGVARNFPVRDVREMGADFVIGSRVATGLLPKEKVNNALQILMQIAFFKEAATSKDDIAQCDIYVPMPLEDYTAGSFGRANELLEYGLEQGRKLYPRFKALADSLNSIYGDQYIEKNRLPKVDSIFISEIEVNGLKETTKDFFEHMMGFEVGRYYNSLKIGRMVRRVFGTRYYNRIVYALDPMPNGAVKIVFDVVENPATFAKLGLNYNNFTGISLIGNLTSRNLFLPHSRSMVTVNVGENFRTRAEHLQYLGRGKRVALILGTQYDKIDISTYNNFRVDGVYRTQLFKADTRFEFSANRKFTVGAGTRFEWVNYKPGIRTAFEIEGKNEYVTTYGYFAVNTLNKAVYPERGIKIEGEAGWIYNQSPKVLFFSNGIPVTDPDSTEISYNDYHRATLNAEVYTPLSRKMNFSVMFQGGINFGYNRSILNDFIVGGLTKTIRNQVLFGGLEENSINSSGVAALQVGLRYEMYNNFYLMGKANGLVNEFIDFEDQLQKPTFLSGYAVGFAYNFALGPLEISAMYSDQTKKIRSYINLGIPF
ncbi:MAG: patatin-like phospholipase family protein [Chitinophagaceae bacterium]|nr:patatin-like phospholipase family protein [Chitinophagaceae bacterium]